MKTQIFTHLLYAVGVISAAAIFTHTIVNEPRPGREETLSRCLCMEAAYIVVDSCQEYDLEP
jgi:hypothetical protein